jgi:hypothetical protein
MALSRPPFINLASLDEDGRIEAICEEVVKHRAIVTFLVEVENGSRAKGDRYIEKMKKKYPSIRVMYRGAGPADEVELIKVAVVQ